MYGSMASIIGLEQCYLLLAQSIISGDASDAQVIGRHECPLFPGEDLSGTTFHSCPGDKACHTRACHCQGTAGGHGMNTVTYMPTNMYVLAKALKNCHVCQNMCAVGGGGRGGDHVLSDEENTCENALSHAVC